MTPSRSILAALACALAACGGGPSGPTPDVSSPPPSPAQELRGDGVLVAFQPVDAAWAPVVHAEGVTGRSIALAFFGSPIAGELRIDVLPDRASLNEQWRRMFRSPPGFQTECWMIAAGNASGIAMLSPGAWTRDSCGHDGQDAVHRSRVTCHEVVHVHHGQHNPSLGLTAGAMAWLVEGLAVYVSGQLDDAARENVRREVVAGRAPTDLGQVLPAGYDWAGSLVAWIDGRYGRATLLDLLDDTQEAAVLERLATTEPALLAAWQADVAAGR